MPPGLFRDDYDDDFEPVHDTADYGDDYDTYDDVDYVPGNADESVATLFDAAPHGEHHGLRTALVVLIILAMLGGLGYLGYTKGRALFSSPPVPDYPGPGVGSVTVSIPLGSSSRTMAALLVQADVVKSDQAFLDAVNNDPPTYNKIQAGTHQLKTQMSGVQALNALADAASIVRKQVTIPEGFSVKQVFDRMSTTTKIPLADFNALQTDHSQLGLPDWAPASSLEGFLYPNTYEYYDDSTATTMLQAMIKQFNATMTATDFVKQAGAESLSPLQALTLASIIQMENPDPEYASDIAQVFLNRYHKGMMLQSDATVAFANNLTGAVLTSPDQRNIDSPYNTYKYAGLPPGPITNPDINALTAAVNATTGTYLYFVTVNLDTGETLFASDAAGHKKNVDKFQAWCNANPGRCTRA